MRGSGKRAYKGIKGVGGIGGIKGVARCRLRTESGFTPFSRVLVRRE